LAARNLISPGASFASDRVLSKNERTDTKSAKALEDALAEPKLQIRYGLTGTSMSANIAPVAAGQDYLNDLVARIRDAHISVISTLSNAVQHALAAGKALNAAKSSKKVAHGKSTRQAGGLKSVVRDGFG
jgi:hypothetical protein